jgi:hypothetical protein
MEALSSSETLVLTRATWRNIPEGAILHRHCRENLKSYILHAGFMVCLLFYLKMEATYFEARPVDFCSTILPLLLYATRQNSLWSTTVIILDFVLMKGLRDNLISVRICHGFRMQEQNSCRKLIVYKPRVLDK